MASPKPSSTPLFQGDFLFLHQHVSPSVPASIKGLVAKRRVVPDTFKEFKAKGMLQGLSDHANNEHRVKTLKSLINILAAYESSQDFISDEDIAVISTLKRKLTQRHNAEKIYQVPDVRLWFPDLVCGRKLL